MVLADLRFGAMDATKAYKFRRFGAMCVSPNIYVSVYIYICIFIVSPPDVSNGPMLHLGLVSWVWPGDPTGQPNFGRSDTPGGWIMMHRESLLPNRSTLYDFGPCLSPKLGAMDSVIGSQSSVINNQSSMIHSL